MAIDDAQREGKTNRRIIRQGDFLEVPKPCSRSP